MNSTNDFGFESEEFKGKITSVPYCQFLNLDSANYGIAVSATNAIATEFNPDNNWQEIEHEFSPGEKTFLYFTQSPRILILNRSETLLTDSQQIIPYSKEKHSSGWIAFSYDVIWFLDKNNQPLSTLPFRLRCKGYAGLTFNKNYSYYNNPDTFCKQILKAYKQITKDPEAEKNNIFYAHAVYCPTLKREKVTSSYNGQSSIAVVTSKFIEPTKDNLASLMIKNKSQISDRVKELVEETKSWIDYTPAKEEKTFWERINDPDSKEFSNPLLRSEDAEAEKFIPF